MPKKLLLRALSLVLMLLMLISLVGCAASRRVRPNARAGRVVATAGDTDILYENLYYLAMTRIAEMKRVYGDTVFDNADERAALEAFVKDNLLTPHEAILALGEAYGLYYDRGEIGDQVQEHMDKILENYFKGDRSAYIESLNAEYLTDRYVRRYLAATKFLPNALVEKMLVEGVIDDSDDEARRILDSADTICVSEIRIETRNFKSDAAAKARAEELRARVVAKTTPEERLDEWGEIWVYGTQPAATGDGTYFVRGEMENGYESAAFDTLKNDYDISEVLAIDGGYVILMRQPKNATYIETHFEELKNKTHYVKLNEKVDEQLLKMPLEMTNYGRTLDLFDLSPVDADGGEWVIALLWVLGGGAVVAAAVLLTLHIRRRKGTDKHKKKGKK